MKILYVTPVIPTQTDGRRPYNFLKYISQRHETHLICMKLKNQSQADIDHLASMGVTVKYVHPIQPLNSVLQCALGLFLRRPLRASWCCSNHFRRVIRQAAKEEQYDVVHFDRLRMGQYMNEAHAPAMLDFTDSLPLYLKRSFRFRRSIKERLIDAWELFSIPNYERKLVRESSAALVCSSIDAEVFRQNTPGISIDVIANGVDSEQFQPRRHASDHNARCIITGTLFYFPNIDSVRFYWEDILPEVRRRFPWMETILVGTRPQDEICKLDGQQGILLVANAPQMEEQLFADDIYLCPLRVAAGVRNKLLEAMAAGMPIITTKLGAEGINVEHDKHVLFADTPNEFVDCIQRLQESPALQKSLGQAARNYVIQNHNYTSLGQKLEERYQCLRSERHGSHV
ncbi:MAG: glycosyltransferase family 4 protein [Candidatus Hinthialibacter antarcticus]|nr:glycosyltransferase family 4 protein [Candidatus Hinthialibacter antarcticus]